MTGYAIHAAEAGTAVIVSERDAAGRIDVRTIERLSAGLDPVAAWLAATFPKLPDLEGATVTIDADGLGRALWDKLKVRKSGGWRLFDANGRERQALVNALLVAMSDRRLHIGRSVHEAALRKALAGYKKIVGDDGIIGGELVVALALAAHAKPRVAMFVGTA